MASDNVLTAQQRSKFRRILVSALIGNQVGTGLWLNRVKRFSAVIFVGLGIKLLPTPFP